MSDAIDPDRLDRAVDHALHRHTDYGAEELDESHVASDPLVQFDRWLAEADARGVYEPNAMVLGTIDVDGTRKGRALAANPTATLLFPWYPVHRQVIVTGSVAHVDDGESDAYWDGRPYGSRIAATASRQSQPIASRAELEERVAALEEQYAGVDEVRRPERWGGFRLRPWRVEFWQGRTSRLHDRIVFTRDPAADASGWELQRLQP
jgi:pyridoxamine 5'-phosphate oxidase